MTMRFQLPFHMKKRFQQLNDSICSSPRHYESDEDDLLLRGINYLSDAEDDSLNDHDRYRNGLDFVKFIGYWENDCDDCNPGTSTIDILPMIAKEMVKLNEQDVRMKESPNTSTFARLKSLISRRASRNDSVQVGPITPTSSTSCSSEDEGSSSSSYFSRDPFSHGEDSDCELVHKLDIPYSRRSTIGDGSENELESSPVSSPIDMVHRDERPNDCHASVSYWSEQNTRAYMEDRIVIDGLGYFDFLSSTSNQDTETFPAESTMMQTFPFEVEVTDGHEERERLTLFGIFDGHCGSNASQFCCDHISSYVHEEETYPYDIGSALHSAVLRMDHDFTAQQVKGGSTACVCALIGGSRIVCANAGDSRAVIVRRNGTGLDLSQDHKPSLPNETKRITSLGGRVIYSSGRWRVEGTLAVSRGVGDVAFKPYITSQPDINDYIIRDDDCFLIVASDGIWDELNTDQVAQMVMNNASNYSEGDNLKGLARKLCGYAKSKGSRDNLSAIIVDLQRIGINDNSSSTYEI